jgi:hypothetical protein
VATTIWPTCRAPRQRQYGRKTTSARKRNTTSTAPTTLPLLGQLGLLGLILSYCTSHRIGKERLALLTVDRKGWIFIRRSPKLCTPNSSIAAPYSSRNRTITRWPRPAAPGSAAVPDTFAPCSSSMVARVRWPRSAAAQKALVLSAIRWPELGSAPLSSSQRTKSTYWQC